MRRRRVLRLGLGAVSTGVAGCLGEPGTGGSEPPTAEPTATPQASPAQTPRTEQPTETAAASELTDQRLVVGTRHCGGGEPAASVRFGDGVSVTGRIVGEDACQTATFGSVAYDGTRLEVVIETTPAEGTEDRVCADCLIDISYEASFTFAGSLPERVVVTHRAMGQTQVVADVSRE